MKKKLLALSVALAVGGVAGTASAAVITTDGGIGQNLVLPYFTTENGQSTLINIVNTDLYNAKAVKIRFRGAVDSDDVFDFQLFLSPGDVWTANVGPDAAGTGTLLKTSDNSCTLPIGVGTTTALGTFQTGRLSSTDPVGVKEGYVEIFNVADIPQYLGKYTAAGATTTWTRAASVTNVNPLWTTVKHVTNATTGKIAPPCNSTTLSNLETGIYVDATTTIPPVYTTVANAAAQTAYGPALGVVGAPAAIGDPIATTAATGAVQIVGVTAKPVFAYGGGQSVSLSSSTSGLVYGEQAPYFAAPTPTLFGNWIIINSKTAGAYGGVLTSTATSTTNTRIVYSAQTDTAVTAQNIATDFPNLASTADAVLLQGFVKTAKYDFPDVSTPYEFVDTTATYRAAAVSSALLENAVANEFLTNSAINAATDWVFTQPTRRYHVAGRVGVAGIYETKTAAAAYAQIDTPLGAYLPSRPYVSAGTGGVGSGTGPVTNFVTYDTKGHRSCVQTGAYYYYDQEETTPSGPTSNVVISPGTVGTTSQVYLCNEAGVVSINNGGVAGKQSGAVYSLYTGVSAGAALIGAVDISLDTPYRSAGWLAWSVQATGSTWGLPLIGQVFESATAPIAVTVNGTATTVTSGFGVNTPHRFTRNAYNTSYAGGNGIDFAVGLNGFTAGTPVVAATWGTNILVQP